MKHKKLFILFVITAIAIAAAVYFSSSHVPKRTLEKEILFPDFAEKINDVHRIEIVNQDNTIVLGKEQDSWVLKSADNYPAQLSKIKATVIALSELRVLATKTSNPSLYSELGVGGHEQDSGSVLLTLNDASDTVLASLIIGKPGKASTAGGQATYVRKPDEKNALLVRGSLMISRGNSNNDWYDHNIIHIPAARIHSANVTKNDKVLSLSKAEQGESEFEIIAEQGESEFEIIAEQGESEFEIIKGTSSSPAPSLIRLGAFFEDMRVEGVQSADNFEFPDDVIMVEFKTFNGLVINVKAAMKDTMHFAHFSFSSDKVNKEEDDTANNDSGSTTDGSETETAADESSRFNNALNSWVYHIPEFKFEALDIDIATTPTE